MIRVSVLYPNEAGKKFDLDYYANTHMELVRQKYGSFGMIRLEIDKGIGTAEPGQSAPFIATGHLYFNSVEDFRKALATHGPEMMGDIPNYTNIEPQIQISEIVE